MTPPVLVSLSGLPGTGKTTLAREACRRLRAVHLRIDSIEHALRAEGMDPGPVGYLAAYAVAEDNLRLGLTVVTDCVNSLAITRQALRDVATRAGCGIVEVELVCSDLEEHRRRVEDRLPDWPGQRLPRWADVTARAVEAWDRAPVRVETAGRPLEACLVEALAAIRAAAPVGCGSEAGLVAARLQPPAVAAWRPAPAGGSQQRCWVRPIYHRKPHCLP